MRGTFDWKEKAPKEDGDFFYTGFTPHGEEEIKTIVQITTAPQNGERYACVFIPPWWRGDKTRTMSVVYSARLEEWGGLWSGPEFGLCTVEVM